MDHAHCGCVDIASAAAMFDCEGCISVSPYVTSDERQRHHCDLFFGMQNLAAVEYFQRTVGVGSVTRRKDVWMFQASGAKAVQAAKTLLPFLRVKREEMALFIEFASTFSARNRKPVPTSVVAARHDLSERIRNLMREDSLSFRSATSATHYEREA